MQLRFHAGIMLALGLLARHTLAAPGQLTVKVDQPGAKISPMFYGLMTEEISHSYDGGLYAELIQNRDLKDNAQMPAHWALVTGDGAGNLALDTTQPVPGTALTNSLRLAVTTAGVGRGVGVANDGFWGIPIAPNRPYRVSFYAKAGDNYKGGLNLAFESADGTISYGRGTVPRLTTDWKQYSLTMNGGYVAPNTLGRFALYEQGTGTVWLTHVSVFPPTFNNRPNGNRPDLMQLLGGLNPSFLRLPGGNYLEGNSIPERFDWKKTIGPLAQRPGHMGTWGYRSSDGLGLLEYLEWCEDLHMQAVLAVYAGYSLNGAYIEPGTALQPYVQDALDEIEYVTGGPGTRWGAQRIKDGHRAPFPLTYVEISNEDGSKQYDERYAQFYHAIKAKYPRLQIIATSHVRGIEPDVVDDHYYRSAAAMAADAHHYDFYPRTGPKIFVGEWASTEGSPTPTMQAALGDAAWLTGLERNSDLVGLEAYAPLLVNVNKGASQWGTNLIGYDALHAFGSPSYYMQQMFGNNRGDVILPVDIAATATVETPVPTGRVGVATWSTQAEFKDVKVTANDGHTLYQSDLGNGSAGWQTAGGTWQAQDGALRQTAEGNDLRALAGDVNWADYTYSLKARKLGGAEGFLIMFHVKDDDNYIWWNIGGWGNSRSALERAVNGAKNEIGVAAPVTVEPGRWYDIRIQVTGRNIKCYLDNKLITEATDPAYDRGTIFATSSRELKSGDIIVKVVNIAGEPQAMQINLQGARSVGRTAVAQLLMGQPGDVNTVTEPRKIAPQTMKLTGISTNFMHEFPAHSVTVLRLKARR